MVLPYRFFGANPTGQSLELAPIVELEHGGLRMKLDGRSYAATLRIGVDDLQSPGQATALPSDVNIELLSGDVEVTPAVLHLEQASFIGYKTATLEAGSPPDEVTIRLRTTFRQEPLEARIPLFRPEVHVEPPRTAIPGLGVGATKLVISVSPDAGERMREIQIALTQGSADSVLVHAQPGKSSIVTLRSTGLGRTVVNALSPPLRSGHGEIRFVFPVAFLCAALLGGAVGTLLVVLRRRRKSGGAAFRHLIAGVLMGILVAGLFILGVNITNIPLPPQTNDLAVFLIAAFGGLTVVPLLDKYSGGVRRALRGPEPE